MSQFKAILEEATSWQIMPWQITTCKFSVDGCPGVGAIPVWRWGNPCVALGQSLCGCPKPIPVWLPRIRGQTRGAAPIDRKINKKFTGGQMVKNPHLLRRGGGVK
ncbi:MAG: hypothetical protein HC865_21825 [Cyanobacteria bacterium RU_5_0]|nr:hypothetical protein [Cyanobacteria bacterium RU_5_0]